MTRSKGSALLLATLLAAGLPGSAAAAVPVAVDDPGVLCQPADAFGGSFPIPEDWIGGEPGSEEWFTLALDCGPLANDTWDGGETAVIVIDDAPGHGDAVVLADGGGGSFGVAYRSDRDYATVAGDQAGGSWLSDSFTYHVEAGGESSEPATYRLWIAPINDAPTFTPGDDVTAPPGVAYSAPWATAISAGPTDESGQAVSFQVSVEDPGLFDVAPAIATDGTLTFTPDPEASGLTTATVIASDDGGTSDYGLQPGEIETPDDTSDPVQITIAIVPDPVATASDDAVTVAEDSGSTTIDVLANDDDPEGSAVVTGVGTALKGTVQVAPSGAGVIYAPTANANGSDSFSYTVTGGSTATVSVTITALPDAPIADDETVTVGEDAAATAIPVLTGDADADGDPLRILSASDPAKGTVVLTGVSGGVATGLTYRPDADATGSDTFTYVVTDGTGRTDAGGVSITITPANDAPIADTDSVTVTEDQATATAVPVLTGDTDVDGDTLTITARTNGAKGTVAITGGGTGLTYKPSANKSGSDTFTYTIADGHGGSATGTVTVTITAQPDPPNAVNDAKSVPQGSGPVALSVLANDTDVDGDTLTITAKTNGAKGTVSITGGGTGLTYDPTGILEGSDTFTYTVSDGKGGTDTATVLVTIAHDSTVPTVSALSQRIPGQTLATNTANTVLVDWTWAGADTGTGVATYRVEVSVDGGAYSAITLSDPAATTVRRTLTVGREYRFRVRATDRAGNTGAFASSPTMTAVRYQQTTSLATYTGTWSSSTNSSMSGGSGRYTSSSTRKVVVAFNGRDVAWVATRTTSSGRADVYVDGVKVATVDLDATATQYRRVVFSRHFTTSGAHTLEIRPLGDGRVDIDAFVVLR